MQSNCIERSFCLECVFNCCKNAQLESHFLAPPLCRQVKALDEPGNKRMSSRPHEWWYLVCTNKMATMKTFWLSAHVRKIYFERTKSSLSKIFCNAEIHLEEAISLSGHNSCHNFLLLLHLHNHRLFVFLSQQSQG